MNTWSSIVQYTFFLNCFIRRAHPIFIFIHSQKNKHCNFPKLQQLQKETIDLHLVRPAREVVLRMWRLRWSSRPMSLSIGGGTAPEHNYWKTTYMFWWTGHIISLWRANSSGRHINVSLSLWFVWKVANLFKLSELSECCKCSSWNIICSICDGTFTALWWRLATGKRATLLERLRRQWELAAEIFGKCSHYGCHGGRWKHDNTSIAELDFTFFEPWLCCVAVDGLMLWSTGRICPRYTARFQKLDIKQGYIAVNFHFICEVPVKRSHSNTLKHVFVIWTPLMPSIELVKT